MEPAADAADDATDGIIAAPIAKSTAGTAAKNAVHPHAGPATPLAVDTISLLFEPILLRQSLVYATLQYRLTLTAPAQGLKAGAQIFADMIAAHASIPQMEQLSPDLASLPLRSRFEAVAPGETHVAKGEIQLPLNQIRTLRQGNAMLFVPLVRLCLVEEDGITHRRVYSIGLAGDNGGLTPLRVDTGPRDHSPVLAREIDAARETVKPLVADVVAHAAE